MNWNWANYTFYSAETNSQYAGMKEMAVSESDESTI
jgi:hypothetical protein